MITQGVPLWGGSRGPVTRNLVEFKAGKMYMRGKMVRPDVRKGLVFVYQSSDSLMHFCWRERPNGTVEDDFIIFPEDATFVRVKSCTTGRVFLLKFKKSKAKNFYWLQEPSTAKDEENCRKINDLLNHPPLLASDSSPIGLQDAQLQFLLGKLTDHQIRTLFNGLDPALLFKQRETPNSLSNGSVETDPSTSPSSSTKRPKENDEETPAKQSPPPPLLVDFNDIVNKDTVKEILTKPKDLERVQKNLPPRKGESKKEKFLLTVATSYFQNAVYEFGHGLQMGALRPALAEFNLGKEVEDAAEAGDVVEFCKALQRAEEKKALVRPRDPSTKKSEENREKAESRKISDEWDLKVLSTILENRDLDSNKVFPPKKSEKFRPSPVKLPIDPPAILPDAPKTFTAKTQLKPQSRGESKLIKPPTLDPSLRNAKPHKKKDENSEKGKKKEENTEKENHF